jgi:hypothetical protein
MVEVGIGDIAFAVAPLSLLRGTCLIGGATGFFYSSGNRLFLITNRHCVIDEEEQLYPNKICFIVHEKQDPSMKVNQTIFLYSKPKNGKPGKPVWLEHPTEKMDLVAIEANPDLFKNCYISAFSKSNFVSDDVALELGEDLLVLGYPLGFYDRHNNFPIVRSATLASYYGIRFRGNAFF